MKFLREIDWKFWTILVVLAAPVTIVAQGTGSLHGLVNTIGQDGKPVYLPGADVSLSCQPAPVASRTTASDDTGQYSFSGVPAGTCTVTGSMPGFKPAVKKVTVTAKTQAEVDLVLSLETVQHRGTVRAAGSLGLLGDKRAIPALQRLAAHDPDPRVQERASTAVRKLTYQ